MITVLPLTYSRCPPKNDVSVSQGNGVFEDSRKIWIRSASRFRRSNMPWTASLNWTPPMAKIISVNSAGHLSFGSNKSWLNSTRKKSRLLSWFICKAEKKNMRKCLSHQQQNQHYSVSRSCNCIVVGKWWGFRGDWLEGNFFLFPCLKRKCL